jgi:hypothetical protein
MGNKFARVALLVAAMMFFAVLALDIAVPAVVLSLMALSNRVVLSWSWPVRRQEGEAA